MTIRAQDPHEQEARVFDPDRSRLALGAGCGTWFVLVSLPPQRNSALC